MHHLRRPGSAILTFLLGSLSGYCFYAPLSASAQQAPILLAERANPTELPDSPGALVAAQTPQAPPPVAGTGNIQGTVVDENGAGVEGALVVLEGIDGHRRTTLTETLGAFHFDQADPGPFRIVVTAKGFATSTSATLTLLPGQIDELPPTTLQVAAAISNVDVIATQHDIAQEQLQLQELQRVLGFIPNFYVSYIWNAAPLSSGQKFHLALRTSIDPVTIGIAAGVAGIQQWQNDIQGYGQGAQGYAKRFGAAYANSVVDAMMGGAIFPSILHQDPRYFYKGTGTIRSRALYAIAAIVICKGDNGHWQPNYSNVLGNVAAAEIANAYYPASDRDGAGLTVQNALIGTAEGAIGNLFQEFVVKKISKGVPSTAVQSAGSHP